MPLINDINLTLSRFPREAGTW